MANALGELKRLESLQVEYGPDAAKRKAASLRVLRSASLARADSVRRLHDVLCFMQAWPDDAKVLGLVDTMLDRFDRRRDLHRHAEALANSGIAGTATYFQFFSVTATWLAERCPNQLFVDWDSYENADALERLLILLVTYGEMAGVESLDLGLAEWIDRLKGPSETDAAFVIRRFAALVRGDLLHEQLFDELDIPLILLPGPDTPSRTRARYDKAPVVYQTGPLRGRPDVRAELDRAPAPARHLGRAEGARLIDLARSAMAAREREIDGFAFANAHDVHLVDDGDLQFVLYGLVPRRRFLLETLYGVLVLKNGVPVSYAALTCLFNSSQVAYSLFDEFRGGESAWIYVRLLAMTRHVLDCDTFMVDPYQLGADNEDGIRSGAWWFYQKLGFRPRSRPLVRLMERELASMKRKPGHRSSPDVLRELSTGNMYLSADDQRDDVMGELDLAPVGLEITDLLAKRFGSDRERGERILADEAATRLGVREFDGWSAAEKTAWRRWSPLVALLDVERWPAKDRRALAQLIRAKGSHQELDYLALFDGHGRLREAVIDLAQP